MEPFFLTFSLRKKKLLSSFSLLFMRLKKRPRLLTSSSLPALRKIAMPLPPPSFHPHEDVEGDMSCDEEENEGLPCADAAARVRREREREE